MSFGGHYSGGARHKMGSYEIKIAQATMQYLKKSTDIVNEIKEKFQITIKFQQEGGRNICLVGPCHRSFYFQAQKYIREKVRSLFHRSYCIQNYNLMKSTPNQAMVAKLRSERLFVGWYFNDQKKTIDLCGEREEVVVRAYQLITNTRPRKRFHEREESTEREYSEENFLLFATDDQVAEQSSWGQGNSRQNGSKGHRDLRAKISQTERVEASLGEHTTETREYTPEVFRYMVFQESSNWQHVDSECRERDVDKHFETQAFTIILKGAKLDTASVFTKIASMVQTYVTVNQSMSKQFRNCFEMLEVEILTELKNRQMPFGWDLRNGRLYVCSNSKPLADEAMKVIKDLVIEGEFPVHEELSPSKIAAIKEKKWNSCVAVMRCKHANSLQVSYNEAKKKIEFALKANEGASGIMESFQKFFEPFDNFHKSMKLEGEMSELIVRNRELLLSVCSDKKATVEIEKSECNFQSQSLESLNSAMVQVKLLIEQKSSQTLSYTKLSHKAWLKSHKGSNKLSDIAKLSQTIVAVDSTASLQPGDDDIELVKKMDVVKGDISTIEADGIVSSQGVIARVIEGQRLLKNPLQEGLQAVTMYRSRNRASAVQVYHTRTDPWDGNPSTLKLLGDKIKQAFQELSGLKVLAIPAIGTGGLNYPRDKVAALMVDTVLNCLKSASTDCKVERVMFVIDRSSADVYQAFHDELRRQQIHTYAASKAAKANEEVSVTFTGLQKQDVEEASRRLEEEFEYCMISTNWSKSPLKPAIATLSQDEILGFYNEAATKNVDIELDKDNKTIELEGMKEGVDSMRESIDAALHNKSMTSQVTKALPQHWDQNALSTGQYEVVLSTSSEEYQQVAKEFHSTSTRRVTINKITRIQNEPLYRQYEAQKSKVSRELKGTPYISIERTLWHGTTAQSVKQICANEFNRSYAGKNATMYGIGSYFSTTSNYSIDYCSDTGYKHIILAKVATGRYQVGTKAMDRKSLPQGYHSTVNNQSNPTIFVVYHDASAYPEYVIQFSTH